MKRIIAALAVCALMLVACSNPFAPNKRPGEGRIKEPAPPATTPLQLMDNLHRAMRDRDKLLYETLLDENFWFTETDCQGDLVFSNGPEEEIEIMGGSRDGSRPGIFDIYRSFEFDFTLLTRGVELGEEYPDAFEGDPDGHPEEDWETFRGQVTMEMVDEKGDGFRVNQKMTYKLRLTDQGVWTIIRWVDDPLDGSCGGVGRWPADLARWASVKQSVR